MGNIPNTLEVLYILVHCDALTYLYDRLHTWGEYKDEGRVALRIVVALPHVKGRRLYETGGQLL